MKNNEFDLESFLEQNVQETAKVEKVQEVVKNGYVPDIKDIVVPNSYVQKIIEMTTVGMIGVNMGGPGLKKKDKKIKSHLFNTLHKLKRK